MNTLSIKGLGIAFGAVTALYLLIVGLTAAFLGWGSAFVEMVSSVYIGYDATIGGSLLGAVYGFIDGFILGAIIAWVYNKVA